MISIIRLPNYTVIVEKEEGIIAGGSLFVLSARHSVALNFPDSLAFREILLSIQSRELDKSYEFQTCETCKNLYFYFLCV